MNIEVRRITDPDLWRECAEMTSGKPCKMSWLDMLKTGHSPIREQRYLIKFYDIPQFVTGHIIRHDKFANPFVQSKRVDHGGADFRVECHDIGQCIDYVANTLDCVMVEEVCDGLTDVLAILERRVKDLPKQFDRYAPSSFAFDVNAEEIINISKARLCNKASKETREIWQKVLDLLEEVDPDLVKLCKRPCVWNRLCRESKSCGYMATESYLTERRFFVELFNPKH